MHLLFLSCISYIRSSIILPLRFPLTNNNFILIEVVTFLQEFLEGYVSPYSYNYSDEPDPLEVRIADAAHAAEDVIESYIVDNIHLAAATTSPQMQRGNNVVSHGEAQIEMVWSDDVVDSDHNNNDSSDDDEDDDADGSKETRSVDLFKSLQEVAETVRRKWVRGLDSLTQVVIDLQEFLKGCVSPFCYSDEADPLEVRIADAAYAAEDVIESYIVDSVHHAAGITHDDGDDGDDDSDDCSDDDDEEDEMMESYYIVDNIQLATAAVHDEDEQIRYINFYQGLQKVIEAIDLIKKEVMGLVKEKGRLEAEAGLEAELPRNVSVDAAIFKSSSTESKSAMVGFEDQLLQLKERLIGIDFSCKIIPITGMGGIGKTTLARNAFQSKLVKEHFDVCLWATISQDHNIVHTLRQVMYEVRGVLSSKGVNELGEELYKHLFGRRYLVVMDDMWSEEVWDKMKLFFPENNNGSRVIVTTRLSNLAVHLTDSYNLLNMRFLDKVSSWDLFSKTAFGEGCFPIELERIGKKIVENCKGLPLALVVIGGLMAKSQQTREYWEYIEKNLSSIVNLESDGYFSRALRLSYNHLPAYLKPCFLYMGVFEEDRRIVVSTLIKLWVSEGFLKPKNGKSLETVAKEYVKELVERNMIMVDELGSLGKIKYCKIHDLLRDLSLKEAEKQRFCYVFKENNSPRDMSSHRRFVIPRTTPEEEVIGASESMSRARSCICYRRVDQLPDFRLLRTLDTSSNYALEDVFGLVNLRYLYVRTTTMSQVPSSINLLWNLHNLVVFSRNELTVPKEIWRMHRLKHVVFDNERVRLPNPPNSEDGNDIVVLENLQTLKGVKNFDLSEEVARRIPNVKKLEIICVGKVIARVKCLSYLCCLSKLDSLECFTRSDKYLEEINFPRSLKKLSIEAPYDIELEKLLAKIGSLLLHTLFINGGFYTTRKWETVEGQFPSLRSLTLLSALHLEKWTMPEDSSSCFPLLERLRLMYFEELEEIPPEVREIPMLKFIELPKQRCCQLRGFIWRGTRPSC